MRKLSMLISAGFFLAVLLWSVPAIDAEAATSGSIIGRVEMVGQDTMMIKEDHTGSLYTLRASPSILDKVSTGYRVEANAIDGRISSLTVLGMPMVAEPQPFQTWTVIMYPDGTTKRVYR